MSRTCMPSVLPLSTCLLHVSICGVTSGETGTDPPGRESPSRQADPGGGAQWRELSARRRHMSQSENPPPRNTKATRPDGGMNNRRASLTSPWQRGTTGGLVEQWFSKWWSKTITKWTFYGSVTLREYRYKWKHNGTICTLSYSIISIGNPLENHCSRMTTVVLVINDISLSSVTIITWE